MADDEISTPPKGMSVPSSRPPTISDVVRGYRMLLGREPENMSVIGAQVTRSADIWQLLETISGSQEAQRRRIHEALQAMRMAHQARFTEAAGQDAPIEQFYRVTFDRHRARGLGKCHMVLVKDEPRFAKRSEKWNIEETLARGSTEADELFSMLERFGARKRPSGVVTVLGANAFRLLGSTGEAGGGLTAIELLDADVARGRRAAHMLEKEGAAAFLHVSDVGADLPETDIFYSVSAFQYLPPPVIVDLLRRCLRAVEPGGYAAFQIPGYLYDHNFDGAAYLAAGKDDLRHELHCIPQWKVLSILADEGFRIIDIVPDERVSVFGISYFYVALKNMPDSAAVSVAVPGTGALGYGTSDSVPQNSPERKRADRPLPEGLSMSSLDEKRSRQPALPVPDGVSRDQILQALTSMSIDHGLSGELEGYAREDCDRFLYTLSLVPSGPLNILEIGANPYFLTYLLREFRPEAKLTLLNYFGGDHGVQSQHITVRRWDGRIDEQTCDYHNHNIEAADLPFEPASFDLVLYCEVIEHMLTDPVATLARIKKVLKPGGALVVTTPNVARAENVARLISGANIYDPYSGYGPYGRHNREYNRHELHHLLRYCGFTEDIFFTADVHPNAAGQFVDQTILDGLLEHRREDLGQYLFTRQVNDGPAPTRLPGWLYRSYPEAELDMAAPI